MESWLPSVGLGECVPPSFMIQVQKNGKDVVDVPVWPGNTYQDVLTLLASELPLRSLTYSLELDGRPLQCEERVEPSRCLFVLRTGIPAGSPDVRGGAPNIPTMAGFMALRFNSLSGVIKVKPDAVGKRWRVIRPGMSLRSRCRTEGCPALAQIIYSSVGYGTFHVERESALLKCPVCLKRANPADNIGFLQARYLIKGMR